MAVPPAHSLAAGAPPLLSLLADGELHSGQWLALQLGVSRAAICKAIARLRTRGIGVEAHLRRGYRLPAAVELLQANAIGGVVQADNLARLHRLRVAFDVDSTNSRLLAVAPPPYGAADVLLSELQSAGRGRRGRHWLAPFGGSLALSMSWSFAEAGQVSPSLSLSVGVAVARALRRVGARKVGLKWPNDVWFGDRKVGGILLEMHAQAGGPAHVVIGVGLNVSLTAAARAVIEAGGVQIATVGDACAAPVSRNLLAGAIIDELLSMLSVFDREGFAAFRETWTSLDALRGRPAQVLLGDGVVRGTARGIDEHGSLLLEHQGRVQTFVSGEVSLRLDGNHS